MNHIVIAHYNQPLDWIKKITTNKAVAVIYSASEPNIFGPRSIPKHFVKNKGMDSSMYLSYIIDNYNNLPERILFCHHHETDWTQQYDLPFIINNLNWQAADYFNIGHRYLVNPFTRIDQAHIDIIRASWVMFQGVIPYSEEVEFFVGTQFCVKKELLLQYDLQFWINLRNWVYESEFTDYYTGRMFEYFWHYLLTHEPIDKDVKYLL